MLDIGEHSFLVPVVIDAGYQLKTHNNLYSTPFFFILYIFLFCDRDCIKEHLLVRSRSPHFSFSFSGRVVIRTRNTCHKILTDLAYRLVQDSDVKNWTFQDLLTSKNLAHWSC